MGSYTFRWPHAADEVYVTGTFDNWSKSVKLDRVDQVFQKTVTLPISSERILYKFFVDGKWDYDHTGNTETDHEGNINNTLLPAQITPNHEDSIISSIGPGASSLSMAAKQPIETIPGAFPISPAANDDQTFSVAPIPASGGLGNPIKLAPGEKVPDPSTINDNTITSTVHDDLSLKNDAKEAEQTFSVNPIPASGGLGNPISLKPGEPVPDPSTLTGNTISSTVHDDETLKSSARDSEQTFGVAPFPATGGLGNPVSLQPGEPIPRPDTFTTNTVTSNVRLDKESYERADASVPISSSTATAGGVGAGVGLGAAGAALLGAPTSSVIPESSIGMGKDAPPPIDEMTALTSSVGAQSTTAGLAGQVPLEPRPAPFTSSVAPESTTASLAGQVPLEPKQSAFTSSVGPQSTTATLAGQVPLESTSAAPPVVADSQEKANADPEASANPEAVEDKAAVEQELQKAVPQAPAIDEVQAVPGDASGIIGAVAGGAAAAGAAAVGAAAVARHKVTESTGTDPVSVLPTSVQKSIDEQNSKADAAAPSNLAAPVDAVPSVVAESQQTAHVGPEAAANAEAVKEKDAMEAELKSKVPEKHEAGPPAPTIVAATSTIAPGAISTTGAPQLGDVVPNIPPISMDSANAASQQLNAPASSQAQSAAAPPDISRDVSPKTGPATAEQTQPIVTTGVASSTTPTTTTPNAKRHSMLSTLRGTPESSKSTNNGSTTDTKEKRKSLFSRIKDKLHK